MVTVLFNRPTVGPSNSRVLRAPNAGLEALWETHCKVPLLLPCIIHASSSPFALGFSQTNDSVSSNPNHASRPSSNAAPTPAPPRGKHDDAVPDYHKLCSQVPTSGELVGVSAS